MSSIFLSIPRYICAIQPEDASVPSEPTEAAGELDDGERWQDLLQKQAGQSDEMVADQGLIPALLCLSMSASPFRWLVLAV